LCNTGITLTEDLESIPSFSGPSCLLLTLKLKGFSLLSLSKLQLDSQKQGYIQLSLDTYQRALNLAQENLIAHHWLCLQLSLDTATIYVKHFRHPKKALDIANKAFDGAIQVMTDINTKEQDNYTDALIILQKIRDFIAKLRTTGN